MDILLGIYLSEFVELAQNYPALLQLTYVIYYPISDMLPICLIFWFHHKNFRIEEDDQRQVRINVHNEDIAMARQQEEYIAHIMGEVFLEVATSEQ